MTGAVLAVLVNSGAAGGGGAGISSPAPFAWSDIYGEDAGATQTLIVSTITVPIQITATRTGGGTLSYILNGSYMPYTGAFTVHSGDSLAWAISIVGTVDKSGAVTVTNATTSTVLDTFNYTVYSSRGIRQ